MKSVGKRFPTGPQWHLKEMQDYLRIKDQPYMSTPQVKNANNIKLKWLERKVIEIAVEQVW